MTHVQADDSIWAQLIRWPTSQLPPVSIGEDHDACEVLGHARPLPPLRFSGSIVRPTAMHQIREDLEAAPTFPVGVDLAVQAVHPLQAGLHTAVCTISEGAVKVAER